MTEVPQGAGAHVERLRREINSGRTGDKLVSSDPAAAPLGADEEAAGTPVSHQAAATAMAHETSRPNAESNPGSVVTRVVIAGVAIAIVAIIVFAMRG